VSCDDCYEAQRLDGISPPCRGEAGCWIPPINAVGTRALEIHSRLNSLERLGIGGAILAIYRANKFDIELIAAIEDSMQPAQSSEVDDGV